MLIECLTNERSEMASNMDCGYGTIWVCSPDDDD